MGMNVSLTASQRATIFQMNQGNDDIATVQGRLNTGKSIYEARHDATTFFIAEGLNINANEYASVKNKISMATKSTDTAINGLESIKQLVEQKQGILNSVRQTTDQATKDNLRATYNSLNAQINTLAGDASYNGKNLINSSVAADHLEVKFNPAGDSKLTIVATTNTATALGLASLGTWGANDESLGAAETAVTAALNKIKTRIQTLGVNIATIETRDDWTTKHINTLKTGADSITLADMNEEAANLKALQMSQFFGMANLGFTNQMQQGVLGLIR